MRQIWGAALAVVMAGTGAAHAKGWELDDPTERLDELIYGLEQVCLPAQRAGQQVGDFEKANRSSLTLQRRQNPNGRATPMWGIDARSDVVIVGDDSGCTVSTSFREEQADLLIPALRGRLTEGSSGYQVVSGDPESYSERLTVAFCKPDGAGGQDSFLLYEWVQLEQPEAGRRQPRDILYVSITTPQEPFCAQG